MFSLFVFFLALINLSGKIKKKKKWQHKLFFPGKFFSPKYSSVWWKWVHGGQHTRLLAMADPTVWMIPMGVAGLVAAVTSLM